MKCRYGHCKHENKEITDENYIKINNSYFHSDCYQENENIKATMELFKTKINPNVVYAELRRVINTIVYNKNVDSAFLLFGLKFYIDKKINLNYPQGLHYVIQNKSVKEAWEKSQAKIIKNQIQSQTNTGLELESNFEYKIHKKKGFGDIIC